MSTSHYSRSYYSDIATKPKIKSSDPNPALISPSRTDDYPEPHMSEMRSVLPAWESPLSRADRPSLSLSRSRPECNDVGMDTIRIPLAAARNYHKAALRARYVALFALAAVMLMADGIALAVWTETVVEHYVFAALAISAELLLIACAIGCRKL